MEGGRIDELMSHILNSEVEEEAFMAGLVGELEVPTLVAPRSRRSVPSARTNGTVLKDVGEAVASSWQEATQLGAQSLALDTVVVRRLERCVEVCERALDEARGAAELRAALRSVATISRSALEADAERRGVEASREEALRAIGKPVSTGEGQWVGSGQVAQACARARAEGRNEALGALAERERLRDKCAVYKARIAHLEAEVAQAHDNTLRDVPLDDDEDDVRRRLELAEKRLAALAGTERAANLRRLERELEERGQIIEALRAALDNGQTNTVLTPESIERSPPPVDLTPATCMPSTSLASDFDDSDETGLQGTEVRKVAGSSDALSASPPARNSSLRATERAVTRSDFPIRLDDATFIV